ncbi:MAG: hypothetical protein ACYCS1_05320 [Gammaproteobacteria bacterium]
MKVNKKSYLELEKENTKLLLDVRTSNSNGNEYSDVELLLATIYPPKTTLVGFNLSEKEDIEELINALSAILKDYEWSHGRSRRRLEG